MRRRFGGGIGPTRTLTRTSSSRERSSMRGARLHCQADVLFSAGSTWSRMRRRCLPAPSRPSSLAPPIMPILASSPRGAASSTGGGCDDDADYGDDDVFPGGAARSHESPRCLCAARWGGSTQGALRLGALFSYGPRPCHSRPAHSQSWGPPPWSSPPPLSSGFGFFAAGSSSAAGSCVRFLFWVSSS